MEDTGQWLRRACRLAEDLRSQLAMIEKIALQGKGSFEREELREYQRAYHLQVTEEMAVARGRAEDLCQHLDQQGRIN